MHKYSKSSNRVGVIGGVCVASVVGLVFVVGVLRCSKCSI